MPEVIVSTVPAELLVTDGEPRSTPIKDTNLLFLSNTANTIFMDTATQEYYALISGRWFKTKALADGSWTYVASNQLPKDFAKIPENSAKGFVLVNVADTPRPKKRSWTTPFPRPPPSTGKKPPPRWSMPGSPSSSKFPVRIWNMR